MCGSSAVTVLTCKDRTTKRLSIKSGCVFFVAFYPGAAGMGLNGGYTVEVPPQDSQTSVESRQDTHHWIEELLAVSFVSGTSHARSRPE
jgi:hypothetical protein